MQYFSTSEFRYIGFFTKLLENELTVSFLVLYKPA